MLSCSGCFYLATAVSHTGVRQECLRANRILIATNGSIALDCTAAYFHPTLFGGGGEQVFETRKYLIGSPAVVRWTVTNALAAGKSSFDRSTNLIEIKQLIYATTNSLNWLVVPPGHGGREATPKDLPLEFHGGTSVYPNGRFPYELSGQTLQLRLPDDNWNEHRTSRRWWGYPVQLFIFPAAAIDIAGWPVEFYIGVKNLPEIN